MGVKNQSELLLDYKEINRTSIDYDTNLGIIDFFHKQVCKNANETALVYNRKQLTYTELDRCSNKVAHCLRKNGIEKGDRVAIILSDKMDFVISLLGIVKLNASYVPVDVDYPVDRIRFMLEDSGSKCAICDKEILEKYSDFTYIKYDEIKLEEDTDILTESCPDMDMDLMYTSGTTGKPKGVALPQKGTIRLCIQNNFYEFKEHDRLLGTNNVIFDVSVQEIWSALLNGLTLYLADKQEVLEVNRIGEFLRENKINVMIMSTSLFTELVRQDAKAFGTLDTILVAGDTLFPHTVKLLYEACPKVQLLNGYGPTENSTLSTCYVVKREDVNREMIPIGVPLSRSSIYILDDNNQLMDRFERGELCVGGVGIAKEYRNRPDISEKKFMYIPSLGETVYRTGDSAAINDDGNVLFYGRTDNQVKIRGFRVELDEIRNVMLEHSCIENVIVAVEMDVTNNKIICAYYIAGEILDPHVLRGYLKEKLPFYSIPNYFYQLEKFPLKINGKIDTEQLKASKEQAINRRKVEENQVLSDTEQIVLSIYKEIFSREDLRIEDDFFLEGGNSLQIGQIIAKIRKKLKVEVSVRNFYSNSEIRKLAAYINKCQRCEVEETIDKYEMAEQYFLSPAQLRIYYATLKEEDLTAYNIPYAFLLDGQLDRKRFKKAMYQMWKRHAILRTILLEEDGVPVQKVLAEDEFTENDIPIEFVERNVNGSESECQTEVENFIQPFSLSGAILWRWKVVEFADNKSLVLFDIHHIIFDGTSQKIFFGELSSLYDSPEHELKVLEYDYFDYVNWIQTAMESETYHNLGEYWKKFFQKDLDAYQLPGKNVLNHSNEKEKISFQIPMSSVDAIKKEFMDEHITLYNYVISCLGITLAKFSAQNDFYIGSIASGRRMQEFSDVIGTFVNTILYSVHIDGERSILDYMKENSDQIMDMLDNQDYSLNDIMKLSKYGTVGNRNEFLQTVFVMEDMEVLQPEFEELQVKRLDISGRNPMFDLLFICDCDTSGVKFQIEYRKGMIQQDVMNQLAKTLERVLMTAFTYKNSPIQDIAMMTEEEKEKILTEFNHKKNEYGHENITYILDDNYRILPIGATGEICVGGEDVVAGNQDELELSKKKYIDNPYEKDGKLYCTGDLGRWNADGTVAFLGRKDNLVMIKGFCVKLEEIKIAMRAYSNIDDVVITTEEDADGQKEICVYFMAEEIVDTHMLRNYLKRLLPVYAVPNYFYQMESFLLNATGKVDEQLLKQNKGQAINKNKAEQGRTVTRTEKFILDMYKKIFNREDLAIEDDFFLEGGNSLQIGQIIAELRKELKVEVSVHAFYSHSVIRELASYVDSHKESVTANEITKYKKAERYPLSPAQKRIYHSCYLDKDSDVYNIPYAFLLEGHVDVKRLKLAFSKMVKRHAILRTIITKENGEAVQQVLSADQFDEESIAVKVINAGEYSKNQTYKEEFDRFIQPFDLEDGALWRWEVIQFSNEKSMLFFDIHHIIFDGTSQEIFFKELTSYYNQADQELEALEYDYFDYVHWMELFKESDAYHKMGDYWKTFLRDESRGYQIPGKKEVLEEACEKGTASFRIPMAFVNSVNKELMGEHITLYNYVISCLGITLSKFANQGDFYIGGIASGRRMQEFADVIGMFVNTIPYRVNIDSNISVFDYMIQNKAQIMDMLDAQDYSLNDIMELSEYKSGGDNGEFLQTSFVMENMEALEPDFDKLKAKRLDIFASKPKFDLLFICDCEPDGIAFHIEYRKGAIEEEFVNQLKASLEHVLLTALDYKNSPIREFKIIGEDQEKQILIDFNDTKRPYESESSIPELFQKAVEDTLDLPALVYQGEPITYKMLAERTDRLASRLVDMGVQVGEVVALFLHGKVEQIVSILSVIKAGGTFMPMDTEYPQKRIDYMLSDSQVRFIITEDEYKNKSYLQGYECIVEADDYMHSIRVLPQLSGDTGAYLMYTSGTTGKPKGVVVTHRNIIRLVNHTDFMEFKKGGKFLQTCSVVFDVSTMEIWGSLLNSMTLYLTKKEEVLNPNRVEQYIREDNIDAIWLSSPLFNQLSRSHEGMFRGVTWLLVGGDVLPAEQINKVRRLNPEIRIVNGYGPTENTTFTTTFEVDDEYASIPIGYPLTNSTVYIMDEGHQLLPVGAIGEICAGGDGVAVGYRNDEELTAKKFINDPYAEGGKIYCTGDLGRWNKKGYIEFLGRKDDQVKVRGFRVETKEIENIVNLHEKIEDSCIDVREKDGIKYLVLFYVGSISKTELKEYLKVELPEYMRPGYVVELEHMPLNVNGKIDHGKIRELEATERMDIESDYVAPENEIEKAMCEVWMEVLGLERVSIVDNYYELGGDSIKAINISGKLYQRGIDINASDILRMKTVKHLSALAEKTAEDNQDTIAYGKYELSPIQNWFYEHVEREQNHFNQAVMLKFRQQVTLEELENAWKVLTEHHDLLNAHFESNDGKRYMVLDSEVSTVQIKEVVLEVSDVEEQLKKIANEEERKLDINKGPLCNMVKIKAQSEEYLLIVIHHLIIDNVSWRILIQSLQKVIECGRKKEEVKWKKTATYMDWNRDVLRYVQNVLRKNGVPECNNPAEFLGNSTMSCLTKDMVHTHYYLDEEYTKLLIGNIHTKYGTKVQDILVTALAIAVREVCNEKSFTLQMEGYGRENDYSKLNISETVGWFTVIYPVEIGLKSGNYEEQLIEVKDKLNQVPNHGIGYNALFAEDSTKKKEIAFFSLNYLGTFEDDISDEFLEASTYSTGDELTGEYLRPSIDLNIEVKQNQLVVQLDYGKELYEQEVMSQFMERFMKEIANVIDFCNREGEAVTTASDMNAEGLDESMLADIFDSLTNL